MVALVRAGITPSEILVLDQQIEAVDYHLDDLSAKKEELEKEPDEGVDLDIQDISLAMAIHTHNKTQFDIKRRRLAEQVNGNTALALSQALDSLNLNVQSVVLSYLKI